MRTPPPVPVGVTTQAALASAIVGVLIALLSLAGVLVDDETTRQIGALVGALIAAIPLVTSIISRGRQASNLAHLAATRTTPGDDPGASQWVPPEKGRDEDALLRAINEVRMEVIALRAGRLDR